jgi:hypothetical protein
MGHEDSLAVSATRHAFGAQQTLEPVLYAVKEHKPGYNNL